MPELTDTERRMLYMEREDWSTSHEAKDDAIRDRFGLRPLRYYQLLNRLIETEPALAYDPITVRRLLRLRVRGHHARHSEVA